MSVEPSSSNSTAAAASSLECLVTPSPECLVTSSPECLVTSSTLPSEIDQSPRTKKPKFLPPCRVCGDKSSGLHYGVNTCEACKGFFRRSHCRGDNFQCAYNDNCEIRPDKRSTCPACRYKKCLLAGMSKEAIKIGRYTHEKRTQDIREMKNISIVDRPERLQDVLPGSFSQLSAEAVSQLTTDFSADIDSSIDRQRQVFSMSVVDEMQRYVQRLSEAMVHMKYFFAAKPPDCLSHLIQKRLDESKFETELLGDDVMPNKEYVKVMAETGLDLDQRKELMHHWAEGIEETFIVVAQFAKCTPGFKQLPLDDQITLIKATRSQLLFAASHRRFDVKHRCFIGRFNRVESYQDIVKVYNNRHFVNMMIDLAAKLVKTRLTDIELLLVLAKILTYPEDRVICQLSGEAVSQLEVMHSQVLRVLDFYIKLNHPDKPDLMSMVHKICQEMREVNKIHDVLVEELQEIWADYYKFPPLFTEIMQSDFKQRIIPRLTPKVSTTDTFTVGASAVPVSSTPKQHWKKSKIAHILQSSEDFEKLMSAATYRSRDENVLPKAEMLLKAEILSKPDMAHINSSMPQQQMSVGNASSTMAASSGMALTLPSTANSLNSKLNSCYGVSFGDPLSPAPYKPLSKCLDHPFTPSDDKHVPQSHIVTPQSHIVTPKSSQQVATHFTTQQSAQQLVTHQPMEHIPYLAGGLSLPTTVTQSPLGPLKLDPYTRGHQLYHPIRTHLPRPIGRGKDDTLFSSAALLSSEDSHMS